MISSQERADLVGADLSFFQFATLGEALARVQAAPMTEVVELLPHARGALLVLKGRHHGAQQVVSQIPEGLIHAWLGLTNPPLRENLVVFESNDAGAVFEAGKRMIATGLEVFDLRVLRGGELKAYVLATGTGEASLGDLPGRLTAIAQPNAALREFFEFK